MVQQTSGEETGGETKGLMVLWSPSFVYGGDIPSKYTGDDKNISPPLEYRHAPQGARSGVLVMHSVGPTGSEVVHWLCYNFFVQVSGLIPEGAVLGTAGINDTGATGYDGPRSQTRTGYEFRLYVLSADVIPHMPLTWPEVQKFMAGHIVMSPAKILAYYPATMNHNDHA